MALTFSDGTRLTFWDHSTFPLKTPGGKILLLDPWAENNPRLPPDRDTTGHPAHYAAFPWLTGTPEALQAELDTLN